ncbi:class II fructose-1,6-bisphosphate aldolase [Patescibacteria group bacterium]|nr:class II fructose-1,6-bisphosphate aldolase [Patescibacteria group bacterium]MBU1029152.1 class II fructose-1,6-bisphosphate aldolase [Patescibacteria group bacterium]MBU1916027.1 class II fructose-1,6-bisphosphate aldolase [Patescibacteria group bacterium]
MLTTLKKILKLADRDQYAVGAFNINNLEILQAVIETAVEEKSPVIVQTSEGAVDYAGMDYLFAMVKIAAKSPIPVAFHLDHGKNLEYVRQAIKSGYTSVMYDGSVLPYRENVRNTQKVVRWARIRGVSVEAEIGAISGSEDYVTVSEKQALFTDPIEAKKFWQETGCDALAISIGTAHGPNKFIGEAGLDIPRLRKINDLVKVPLVLHGASSVNQDMVKKTRQSCKIFGDCNRLAKASGVPDKQIHQAIRAGIRKINIDTDLRIAFTAGIREAINSEKNTIDPRQLLAPAKRYMKDTVRSRMRVFGSRGKA